MISCSTNKRAISHTQAAGCSIIFAINRLINQMQILKIKEVSRYEFTCRRLGWVNSNHDISAKVGTGKELLEKFY
jgi:hypothetical protein